jgi:hypothetical protein
MITIARRPQVFTAETIASYSSTPTAPYKCKECGKPFDAVAGVKLHWLRSHGKIKGSTRNMASDSHTEPDLGGDPYHGRNGNGTAAPPPKIDGRAGGKGSRGPRKYWTPTEYDLLHEQVMELWHESPEDGLSVALIKKAMHKIIAQDRWRTMNTVAQCEEVWKRAGAAIREIIAKADKPPEVKIEVKEIHAPVNVEEILAKVSLGKLAGIVAQRETDLRERYYLRGAVYHEAPREEPAKQAEKELANKGVIDPEAVQGLLPRVQVIGFRSTQHAAMVQQFKDHPIILFPSIDPATPPTLEALAPKATWYLMDNTASIDGWRTLVNQKFGPEVRATFSGPSRVLDRVKQIASDFAVKNPAAHREWQRQHFTRKTI